MDMITRAGGKIKYGHCEVGNFTLDGKLYEQNEIEFLPVPAEDAADQLMLAKWIIRNQAMREGLDVSFAPKITTGKAGSGLHIHMRLMRDGRNIMLNNDLRLSDDARRLIAGLMEMAPSITAFGNTTPTSYFRLVPHQEAPTNVCWGDRNRSALVRVPLGWSTHTDMSALANPGVAPVEVDPTAKQTIEIRSADGSADIYLLLASLAVAARRGFEMGDKALLLAERTYVSVNIHDAANADRLEQLDSLPVDCAESSVRLDEARDIYEADGVFSPAMIDAQIAKLRNYEATDSLHMKQLVEEYFHCG
jgi:glutamine synthetase